MKAKTIHGHEIELKPESIDGLRMCLRGPVIIPGDNGYEDSRTVWNGMIGRKPSLIVRCFGVADVIACMHFIREHELLLCIKNGGHNIAGLAVADGAFMIDVSQMRGVWVDPEKRIAHAQAGCLIGDVDRETQVHGLATVLGFISATGISGLTLGGGFGYLTRRWGWTTDNVTALDMVTAEAELVHASRYENPDLYWALRGGGGNFGIVTSIDYMLNPVGPEIVGGMVAWPASDAPKVLELYRTMAESAPPELTLVSIMRPTPPAPWVPKYMHGKPMVAILACYSGNPVEGEKIVAPIKSFGTPIGDVLVRRPYVQMQTLLDAAQPKGRRYYWKSEYLTRIEPALCDKVIAHASRIRSPHSALILFQIGGALNQFREDHNATGNRNARYLFNVTGSWEKAEDDEPNIAWARDAWNDMKSFSSGGNYINFLTEDESPERVKAAMGGAIQRLGEIKAKWDPHNIFRTNRNIKPVPTLQDI